VVVLGCTANPPHEGHRRVGEGERDHGTFVSDLQSCLLLCCARLAEGLKTGAHLSIGAPLSIGAREESERDEQRRKISWQ